MNIFFLSHSPGQAAEWHVDRHVVKMLLELAQLLSTAHRVLDGQRIEHRTQRGSRWCKRTAWNLHDDRQDLLYAATHVNHPCAKWVRENVSNYTWAWCLLDNLCVEYTYRYGKVHKVERDGLLDALRNYPKSLKYAEMTLPPNAMDTKYIISEDPVENYRNYYKHGKAHLHSWKNREVPEWIKEQ